MRLRINEHQNRNIYSNAVRNDFRRLKMSLMTIRNTFLFENVYGVEQTLILDELNSLK